MKKHVKSAVILCGLVLQCAIVLPAQALTTRTWVSGAGSDQNACSLVAPCKTYAFAITKTAAGGEIDALGPGGFGSVTINKAVTIDGGAQFAAIAATGRNGIVVRAGPKDVVILRNLRINGFSSGAEGVKFTSGAALHIESTEIFGFTVIGVAFKPDANPAVGIGSSLFMKDVTIENTGGGIAVKPAAGMMAVATLDHVRLTKNKYGLLVFEGGRVSVNNSVASGNSGPGFAAESGGVNGKPAILNLANSMAAENGGNGVGAINTGALVSISNVEIFNNKAGIFTALGGRVDSFGNNRLNSNDTDGVPTGTLKQQ